MLKLFHAPGSASTRIVWLLEELRAEYQIVFVSDPYTGGAPDPRNPHPHGFTPALVHDSHLVTETGAIALYLTDLWPDATVSIPAGHGDRGRYLTWLFYQVGLTEPLLYMKKTRALHHDSAMAKLDALMMTHITHTLTHQGPYLVGEQFTAADILMMSLLEQVRPMLGDNAVIDSYLALGNRPARREAMARAVRR